MRNPKPKKDKEQSKITERRLRVINYLKRGFTPNYVICRLIESDGLAETTASSFVYKINGELNKTNTELMTQAKDYIINALLGVIEECNDIADIKSKLQAIKQLSDVTKITEVKNEININNNFGFDFDVEKKDNE